MAFATANPAANLDVYQRSGSAAVSSGVMTLGGTVFKTAILLGVMLTAAAYTWSLVLGGNATAAYPFLIGGAIGGAITAFVTIFFPKASPITAPIYAGLEGLVLGALSSMYEGLYNGIAIQAVGLTAGTLAVLLILYTNRVIRATEKFKIGIVAATGAVCLVYFVDIILRLFGIQVPMIHESSWLGIGFSLVVVVIASLNLILDFDFIEQGVAREAPKYMEWYGGFTLMVTLVWMYLEMLRLLGKLRGGDR